MFLYYGRGAHGRWPFLRDCVQHGDLMVLLYGEEYLFILRKTARTETERSEIERPKTERSYNSGGKRMLWLYAWRVSQFSDICY